MRGDNLKTHGLSRTTEYNSWSKMKERCNNIKCKDYHYYGGKGITVCDAWNSSFMNFFVDMGLKPSPLHSIDRIDSKLGYSKDNCRWATRKTQVLNRGRFKGRISDLPIGVCRANSISERYSTQITIDYCHYFIGTFGTPREARDAYVMVYKEWHGHTPYEEKESA